MTKKSITILLLFVILLLCLCSCSESNFDPVFSSYQEAADAGKVQLYTQEEAAERGISFCTPMKYKSDPPPSRNLFYSAHAGGQGGLAVYNMSSSLDGGRILNIYDINGEYQYSFHFFGGDGGTMSAMEWMGDTIVTYWARSRTFTHFDLSGKIICVGEYSREFEDSYFPALLREAHGASKPLADGTVIEVRVSHIFEYPLAFRSRIVRIDPDGNETVIYRARLLESNGLTLLLLILIAFPLAIWMQYRRYVKKHGSTKGFWPDIGA